jgi:serine/threonine protein phosphatase 1
MADHTAYSGDSTRLYVIGDIHGRADLLDQIVERIGLDIQQYPGSECLTVTLGDYIDRGPDSRGVLDRLARNPFPTDYLALKGNHELLFEGFMQDPSVGHHLRRLGGLETIHSYRVPVSALMTGQGFEEAGKALKLAIPNEHLRFLRSLKTSLTIGKFFLCHAGVRPGVSLERQNVDDLLWIREEFLTSTMNFGKIVIHGHSPNEWPEVRPNRINIDTGAFATGRLTCLVVENGRAPRFLFTA